MTFHLICDSMGQPSEPEKGWQTPDLANLPTLFLLSLHGVAPKRVGKVLL